MGFNITGGGAGFGDAILIVLAISLLVPIVIWIVTLTKRAREDVIESSDHDLEA